MKALILNGTFNNDTNSTPGFLSQYLKERLPKFGLEGIIFNIAGPGIPLFDPSFKKLPRGVEWMRHLFLQSNLHFWLAPLYHGCIPGIMKNCVNWMEVTAENDTPLSDRLDHSHDLLGRWRASDAGHQHNGYDCQSAQGMAGSI